MMPGKFVTAITCIDGRATMAITEWMIRTLTADYLDLITEPGPDKMLTQGAPSRIEEIKQAVLISITAHGSRTVAVAAHYDCAANPLAAAEHKMQIEQSVALIREWDLPVTQILGLWCNESWQIEVITDIEISQQNQNG